MAKTKQSKSALKIATDGTAVSMDQTVIINLDANVDDGYVDGQPFSIKLNQLLEPLVGIYNGRSNKGWEYKFITDSQTVFIKRSAIFDALLSQVRREFGYQSGISQTIYKITYDGSVNSKISGKIKKHLFSIEADLFEFINGEFKKTKTFKGHSADIKTPKRPRIVNFKEVLNGV